MKAMVLAAGVGSRLDPLTSQSPKPLVPVVNKPVMEHILVLLNKHGFNNIISNLHYLPDQIRHYFGDGSQWGLNLNYHFESELSGDAGGVRACKKFFGNDTFLVVMGDLLTDADITRVFQAHKQKKALATIGIKKVDDVSHFGVVLTDANGFITGFQEKPKPQEALSHFASTGIYILEPAIFDYIPKTGTYGFGRQLFPFLVESGLPVLAVDIDAYWSDIGTIAQYRQSNFDSLAGKVHVCIDAIQREQGLLASSAQVHPDAYINGKLLVGQHSRVDSGLQVYGSVIIGNNCTIEKNVKLENTIVWSSTKIESGVQLHNCIVGSHCTVSTGAKHLELVTVSL